MIIKLENKKSVPTHGVYNTDLIHDVNPSPFTVRRGPVAVVHLADLLIYDLVWLREALLAPLLAARRGSVTHRATNLVPVQHHRKYSVY